jgi:hypothetical protein
MFLSFHQNQNVHERLVTIFKHFSKNDPANTFVVIILLKKLDIRAFNNRFGNTERTATDNTFRANTYLKLRADQCYHSYVIVFIVSDVMKRQTNMRKRLPFSE